MAHSIDGLDWSGDGLLGGRRGGPDDGWPPAGPLSGLRLPVPAAVALALGAGLGGGTVDVLTGSGLRSGFAVSFVLGCVLAAALVRRRGLGAAVVAPPLTYLAVVVLTAFLQSTGDVSGSWVVAQSLETMSAMMTTAPILVVATAGAAVVAVVRSLLPRGAISELRHGQLAPRQR